MGSGTLVDGVRRWFQRRSSTSSTTTTTTNNDSNNAAIHASCVFVTEVHAQSSASATQPRPHHQKRQPQDPEAAPALTLIKVPKRRPMDPHKKVCLLFSPDLSKTRVSIHFFIHFLRTVFFLFIFVLGSFQVKNSAGD